MHLEYLPSAQHLVATALPVGKYLEFTSCYTQTQFGTDILCLGVENGSQLLQHKYSQISYRFWYVWSVCIKNLPLFIKKKLLCYQGIENRNFLS